MSAIKNEVETHAISINASMDNLPITRANNATREAIESVVSEKSFRQVMEILPSETIGKIDDALWQIIGIDIFNKLCDANFMEDDDALNIRGEIDG